MDEYLSTDNTRLWLSTPASQPIPTSIGLQELERDYVDGRPAQHWTATLVARHKDIVSLVNWPEQADLFVVNGWAQRDIVLHLRNCKPVQGWFSQITTASPEPLSDISYWLTVRCQMDYVYGNESFDG